MPEHPQFPDDAIVNPETHHEESDVNVRALMLFVVIFIVFAAVTNVALWLLFKFYVQVGKATPPPPMTEVTRPADANVPALPRLQPFPTGQSPKRAGTRSPVADTPVADMEQMRAHEEQVLNNPGWVDPQKGIVHIPIEQAKQLALQRGLYPVNTATASPSPGQSAAAPLTPATAPPQAQSNPARIGTTTTTGNPKP